MHKSSTIAAQLQYMIYNSAIIDSIYIINNQKYQALIFPILKDTSDSISHNKITVSQPMNAFCVIKDKLESATRIMV